MLVYHFSQWHVKFFNRLPAETGHKIYFVSKQLLSYLRVYIFDRFANILISYVCVTCKFMGIWLSVGLSFEWIAIVRNIIGRRRGEVWRSAMEVSPIHKRTPKWNPTTAYRTLHGWDIGNYRFVIRMWVSPYHQYPSIMLPHTFPSSEHASYVSTISVIHTQVEGCLKASLWSR